MQSLASQIKVWGAALGFQQIGITDVDLSSYESRFLDWLKKGFQGEMHYMAKHGVKRTRPAQLLPETIRIISGRMDYLPPDTRLLQTLKNPRKGYISRYALGRDYHRLMRKRLSQLTKEINTWLSEHVPPTAMQTHHYRAFCDSAPVLEKAIAEKAGLGWIGKHTNLINSKAGSWFFLGEIYTNLPLPIDPPQAQSHCGSCTACLTICPTQAIVAPYQLDARRCISYLTIELRGSIPVALRPLIGNRIYGCDDCQLVCPWNKFAKFSHESDFHPRHQLHTADLVDLFAWSEEVFLKKTEGSAIRRIGHASWLRNIAVALGNAPRDPALLPLLQTRRHNVPNLVKDHIDWAIQRHNLLI